MGETAKPVKLKEVAPGIFIGPKKEVPITVGGGWGDSICERGEVEFVREAYDTERRENYCERGQGVSYQCPGIPEKQRGDVYINVYSTDVKVGRDAFAFAATPLAWKIFSRGCDPLHKGWFYNKVEEYKKAAAQGLECREIKYSCEKSQQGTDGVLFSERQESAVGICFDPKLKDGWKESVAIFSKGLPASCKIVLPIIFPDGEAQSLLETQR